MKSLHACESMAGRLDAFVDGELRGDSLLAVSHHLESCEGCGAEVEALRFMGDALRESASSPLPDALDGLAGGLVSRVRAERDQSWSAAFGRAFEDWHWAFVGLGSVTAAVLSVFLVVGLVQLATPERDDSLSALLQALGSRAGSNENPLVMQFDRMQRFPSLGSSKVVPVALSGLTDQDATVALDAVVTREGRVTDLQVLSGRNPQEMDALLAALASLRFSEPALRVEGRVAVRMLWFVGRAC